MTDAQTEAQAIAAIGLLAILLVLLLGGVVVCHGEMTTAEVESEAAALAAKDAELEKVKAECDKWREAFGEMHRQTMRAEAQLAEANKALERIEATAKDKSEKAWYRLETIADEAHFTCRAREQGGE